MRQLGLRVDLLDRQVHQNALEDLAAAPQLGHDAALGRRVGLRRLGAAVRRRTADGRLASGQAAGGQCAGPVSRYLGAGLERNAFATRVQRRWLGDGAVRLQRKRALADEVTVERVTWLATMRRLRGR